MKQPGSLIKVAAVTSAILLIGGFICYSAGAFDWLRKPSRSTTMGGSKSKVIYESKWPIEPTSLDSSSTKYELNRSLDKPDVQPFISPW
jgi:hypothetical protein